MTAIEVADVIGLDTAFSVDEVYHRDAWLLLAIAAARTRRIRLAAGVADVTLRDPLLMAQMLATLDEASGGRAAAAFSVGNLAMLEQSSMPRALIERHGVPFTEVEPINDAFARGDVATALTRTPPELADRFCIAATPEEVAARIQTVVLPSGINHVALALTDRSQPVDWAGIELPDLPDLADQIRLVGERVLPAL